MAALGVGAGAPPGARSDYGSDQKALLNTYIHNYFVHEGHYELAKAIRSSEMAVNQQKLRKETGNNKQVNGTDESMDADSKDDMRNRADSNGNKLGDTFLLDYWFIFWDMWSASKKSADKPSDNAAAQYWDVQKAKGKMPPQQQMPMMVPNQFGFPGRGPMMPGPQYSSNLQRAAMVNNGRNMQPGQMMRQQPGQVMGQNMGGMGIHVDGSDMDMNGQQRPQSPMSGGENAPSPKRQRLDGAPFNNQQINTPGRNPMMGALPNGAAGNAEAMRMQDPKGPSPAHMNMNQVVRNNQNLYSQQLAQSTKGIMTGAPFGNGMPNGVANGMPQVSPMMPTEGMDPNFMNGQRGNMANGNGGALADYQMQLMLLEQQNKKRLMVARQENAHGGQQPLIGQNGFGAPAMSPRGSRTGHSPNGTDRQRQTPRMGQGSPLPDGSMPQGTGSPVPPNFNDPNQMNLNQQFNPHGNGGMMRPPGTNGMNVPESQMNAQQLEMLQRSGRLPNGAWPNGPMPGPMGPQTAGPQQSQGETNQQRGIMAPPQAPSAAGNNGRSQPSPTPQNAAPPTPSQNNKNTKKKDGKETKKKNNKKAQSTTGATPNADSERPPTPTPQTPMTPVNPESHVIKGQQPNQASSSQNQTVSSTNTSAQPGLPTAQDNNNNSTNNAPFGSIDTEVFNINDLHPIDNSDVLDGFDFDTYFDASALGADFGDFSMSGDAVEAGTGDQN